jgi:pilus assembly protein CpaB
MADQGRPETRWNLPIVAIGVVIALLGFGVSVLIGTQQHAGGGPTRQIVVAARDLDQRATLRSSDLKISSYLGTDVPPGAFTKIADAVGKVLQAALKSGQPVLSNQVGAAAEVVGTQTPFLPLPASYVAATVPTGELVGVAGYIQPGDYIDVIAVVPSRTGGSANVRTIYSGVHVIRTGPANGDAAGASTGAPATSLTLSVTECQADFIAWFVANASLKYSLLSAADYQQAASAPPDAACPAEAFKGVTESDIKTRWPGLVP